MTLGSVTDISTDGRGIWNSDEDINQNSSMPFGYSAGCVANSANVFYGWSKTIMYLRRNRKMYVKKCCFASSDCTTRNFYFGWALAIIRLLELFWTMARWQTAIYAVSSQFEVFWWRHIKTSQTTFRLDFLVPSGKEITYLRTFYFCTLQ